ncbi:MULTISPECIES: hypothetical protein [unclassified Pseudonocardia]|uniref:hypothetical protein n=1 Tax=unclassified Pseudonocardia TaxID=2619320 RepID=UPI00094AD5A6|nr:hypothetical protein [Pseudonocardia sp. Ae707_Ps1]OLM21390.1 hypothetical protein Ae707Ps1_5649c [Pseudonocardia sp. Ae707_Ps1]
MVDANAPDGAAPRGGSRGRRTAAAVLCGALAAAAFGLGVRGLVAGSSPTAGAPALGNAVLVLAGCGWCAAAALVSSVRRACRALDVATLLACAWWVLVVPVAAPEPPGAAAPFSTAATTAAGVAGTLVALALQGLLGIVVLLGVRTFARRS